jgi:hypothetical protein
MTDKLLKTTLAGTRPGMRTVTVVTAISALVFTGVVAVLAPGKPAQSQQTKAVIDTGSRTRVDMGDYEPVVPWPLPLPDTHHSHEGWTWGSGAGVWAESPDKVWVAQRGEIELPPGVPAWTCACMLQPPRTNTGRRAYSGKPLFYKMRREHLVFAVDRNGKTINEWHQHNDFLAPPRGSGLGEMGRGPHKLLMNPYDPEKRIWIVDDDMHQIMIFSNDGKLLKTMGERGVPGRGPNHFNRVTDIAWLPDGTFFVADGYAGTRVAKFSADGKFIKDWGRPPVDPANPKAGEFWSVHSIGISRDRRIFVADRQHHRMQVFDEDGNFLAMWPTGYNSSVLAHLVTHDDHVWVADWTTNRLVKYDLEGRYILDIGGPGPLPGQFDGVHQIHVDSDRNLYVTEVANCRSQKFTPKKNADPNRLVGMMARVNPERTRK